MVRGCEYVLSPLMSKPMPQNEQDVQATVAADTDNDTSFEIDEPEDEETIALHCEEEEVEIDANTIAAEDITRESDGGMSTPTNDVEQRKSITGSGLLRKKSTTPSVTTPTTTTYTGVAEEKATTSCIYMTAKILSPQQSSQSHSLQNDYNSEDEIDSDVSCDSYTFSSTPTTADVADVSLGNLNRYSNASGGSSGSHNLRKHLIASKHQTNSPYLPDDNNSASLATTTTELEVVDQHQIQREQSQQQQQAPSVSPTVTNLRRNTTIGVHPTVLNIPSMILNHPSAALQENSNIKVSSSLELPTTSGGHRQHKRCLSGASRISLKSGHSLHSADPTFTLVVPGSKIRSLIRWSSGIGSPSVYHAMVVIFLEFFSWGLLAMPLITVLKQTFPDRTFLMNGLVMGIKGLLSFLMAPLVGALSDIWGRKFFLLLTVFSTCCPIPLMSINSWWFFAMISITGIFSVTFSVVFAYVADVTTLEERSRAYGLVAATYAASLVVSPALGAMLMERYSLTVAVTLATAIAVLDVFFILVALPESLPEKVRPSSWGAPFNWEQADPFAALRKVSADRTILLQCFTVFLSYLPEAGQYSCMFVYLKLKMHFSIMEVAIFIAVVGTLSIITQVTLGFFMSKIGGKRTIIVGLILESTQLFWYGFGRTKWMMWTAGILASLASITYPAISAFVSIHSTPDRQGAVQGMVTGMRGLCNGLGPAMFGIVFYLFNVDLNNEQSVAESDEAEDRWYNISGPPFAIGGVLVILAILVALFIPDAHGSQGEKKRASVDVQYEVEAGHKPTSPLMRSDSLAQL